MTDTFYINPGELRTKIRIQYSKQTGTGINKETEWVDLGNASSSDPPRYIMARWIAMGSLETMEANSEQAIDVGDVTVRYNPQITSQCRVLKDGVAGQIISPTDPTQRKQWIFFKVKTAVKGYG